MKSKDQQIEEAKECYRKEVTHAYRIFEDTIRPFQLALGDATASAQIILRKTVNPAWNKLQAKIKEIENE